MTVGACADEEQKHQKCRLEIEEGSLRSELATELARIMKGLRGNIQLLPS